MKELLSRVVEFEDDREWVDIVIKVDEGERYVVDAISFEGNEVLSAASLREHGRDGVADLDLGARQHGRLHRALLLDAKPSLPTAGARSAGRRGVRRSGDRMNDGGTLWLAAVNLIIWTGLFIYLLRIDRRLSRKERDG